MRIGLDFSSPRVVLAVLIYLAPDDILASLASLAEELPELYFQAKVMEAVASGNIDSVLLLGTNAAQAAAQPLRAAGKRITATRQEYPETSYAGGDMWPRIGRFIPIPQGRGFPARRAYLARPTGAGTAPLRLS